MAITKNTLKLLREDINQALKEVGEKHNVSLNTGNCSYDAQQATFKLGVVANSEDGKVVTKSELDFYEHCESFGLSKADFGKKYKVNGKVCEINGLKPRSYKFPILATDIKTGVCYKFKAESFTNDTLVA
jgi:hypothetical protein